mgnify:CR=1 FL=1
MESSSSEITIYGVLVGAVLPLLGYIVFHRLASHRERESRIAKAAADFRSTIIEAVAFVPPPGSYWDNNVLKCMPDALAKVKMALDIYSYFLSKSKRNELGVLFARFQVLVESEIPTALSTANVMYGGGQCTPEEARVKFHKLVQEILKYGTKT